MPLRQPCHQSELKPYCVASNFLRAVQELGARLGRYKYLRVDEGGAFPFSHVHSPGWGAGVSDQPGKGVILPPD